MGNSSSSKKKLDTSNTPANEGRKKKSHQPPPFPTIKPQEAEKPEEKAPEVTATIAIEINEKQADNEDKQATLEAEQPQEDQKSSESKDENIVRVGAEETPQSNGSGQMSVSVEVKVEDDTVATEDARYPANTSDGK